MEIYYGFIPVHSEDVIAIKGARIQKFGAPDLRTNARPIPPSSWGRVQGRGSGD